MYAIRSYYVGREHQLAIDDALEITKGVAGALDYAHRQGVIHRDVKPENILLLDGVALVADFGIALAVTAAGGERLTDTGLSLGTPAYMSPEQVAGDRDLDGRSDMYSLACVTYEMLAGDPPFVASSVQAVLAKHIADPAPPITTMRASVSPAIAKALAKARQKTPAVITSYSIHYTKLYDVGRRPDRDAEGGDPALASQLVPEEKFFLSIAVITSYSIHYTKLYDNRVSW